MKPAVSIIVPVYNVEAYLDKCLESVVNQSFDNYEVIIINDGSTDKSEEIAQQYTLKYDHVILINQENKGLGGARNTGLKIAQGEYILFVDSDDYIHRDTLMLAYNEAMKKQADIVVFGYTIIDELGNIIKTEKGFENAKSTLKENRELLMCPPVAWNKLIKKDLFVNSGVQFPDRAWYEDLRTILKLYLHAQSFGFVDKSLYFYLKRKGSITNALKTDRLIEIVDAVEDLLNYYKEQNAYEQYKDELEFIAVYHAFYLGSVRVAQINYKHPLMLELKQYITQKVPNYMHQKYLYRLGKSRQIVLKLLNKQHYATISLLLKIKGI